MVNGETEREEIQGEGAPVEQPITAEKPLEVDLSDDGDDDDAAPEQPTDRKGRRANFRRLRDKLSVSEERSTRLERELAELRGQVTSLSRMPAQQREQKAEVDPVDAQIDGLERQQMALIQQMRADGASEERVEKLQKEYRGLGRQIIRLAAKAEQGPQFDKTAYENEMLSAEFPDVFGDAVRLQEAKTELMKLARAGKPINIATAREAARLVSKRHTRPSPEPSAADRSRYTSVPSRPGAGGASGKFTPSKAQLNAARAFTAHLDDMSDEDRVKIWVKKVGKKHGLVG